AGVRFGRYFSRPICKDCKECLSLRILVDEYQFSRVQIYRKLL
ncbi:hypothetical protein IFO25_09960, partial [Campylobacter coli]|nr:hypothetical protein [Campylobacter coli]